MLDLVNKGPIFRFEQGTTGEYCKRKITFIRSASSGYLVEFHADPEAENVPGLMRGSRPDIEFVGRKIIPHTTLTEALLEGSLVIEEENFVFIDHSQTFKPEFVASLDDRQARDLILRYASVSLMREICIEKEIFKKTRRVIEKLEPEVLKRLPDRIDLLLGKVDRLRRYPFRGRQVPLHSATGQRILFWDDQLRTYGFHHLVDRRNLSGNKNCKLEPVVAEILKAVIDKHECLEGIPKAKIHRFVKLKVNEEKARQKVLLNQRELNGEIISDAERAAVQKIKPPSIKTVRSWIAALSPLEALLRGKGPDFLLQNCLAVGMGLKVERAGQIVMIDEYPADLMTIIPFGFMTHWLGHEKVKKLGITADKPLRVMISAMIDAYTGCILGLQIGLTATPDLARRTFMMAMTDKTKLSEACNAETSWDQFLRPEKVMHDSGNAYLAGTTEMMCAMLGIDKMSAPKAKAYIRGLMERVFRTIHENLLSQVPGRTFSNTVKRGDYDSEAEAILTLDDLIQIITIWITDIYHNSENLGRDGLTPADLWHHEMTVGMGCRPVPSLKTMTHVFGETLHRKAQGNGIRIMHVNYSSKEFASWMLRNPNRTFKLRWWEDNMSEIQVQVGPDEWMQLEVMDPRARGLSIDEWMLVLKRDHIARNPDAAAIRDRAEEKIQEMIENRMATRKRAGRKPITEAVLKKAEERALRYFTTPTTQITSDQTHGLYGASVSRAADTDIADDALSSIEDGQAYAGHPDAVNSNDDFKPESEKHTKSASRGRRAKTAFKPGSME
ncbi:MAG: hypothetical protein ACSHWZ_07340 [Sulfitobacter sp.]